MLPATSVPDIWQCKSWKFVEAHKAKQAYTYIHTAKNVIKSSKRCAWQKLGNRTEVGIFKRKQESKKTRTRPRKRLRKQEKKKENKNSTKKAIKKTRKKTKAQPRSD